MTPLTLTEQLRYITEGKVREAVDRHVDGDWSRRNELFDIPRSVFDNWVDTVPTLPTPRIHLEAQTFDGLYVIRKGDLWTVYEQERGWIDPRSVTSYATFEEAKRDAFAREYLWALSLR